MLAQENIEQRMFDLIQRRSSLASNLIDFATVKKMRDLKKFAQNHISGQFPFL
jgi:hypothetical protein